jgi:Caspase domain
MKKAIIVYHLLLWVVALNAQQTFGKAGIYYRPINYFMSYACSKGQTVSDVSVYTERLSKALSAPIVDLEDVFKSVRSEMQAQSQQISEEHHTLLNRVNLRDKSKKKIAFLLGNQDYKEMFKLQGPAQDVAKMQKALVDLGFEVQVFQDLAFDDKGKLDAFIQKAKTYDIALFYYSGMGMETDSSTCIFPVDITTNTIDASHCWNLQRICHDLARYLPENVVKILIYDSCRDNPPATR